jgi:hypothetical protein
MAKFKPYSHVQRKVSPTFLNKLLVGKPEGKRLLGRPGRRWNIITDLKN